jgi:ABC-type transporter Mla MlaB component
MLAQDAMTVECRSGPGDAVTFNVSGELDVSTVPELERALDAALRAGHSVQLDLRRVTFAGVAAVDLLSGRHLGMTVIGLSSPVLRLLTVVTMVHEDSERRRDAVSMCAGPSVAGSLLAAVS